MKSFSIIFSFGKWGGLHWDSAETIKRIVLGFLGITYITPETDTVFDMVRENNLELKDCLNDMLLIASLYRDGYAFDDDHKEKHKHVYERAEKLLGIFELSEKLRGCNDGKN